MATIRIIADSGGGITLQIEAHGARYQHYYSDAEEAAHDIIEAETSGTIADWEGNDLHNLECDGGRCTDRDHCDYLEPTLDDIANGGYREFTPDTLRDLTGDYGCDDNGYYAGSWGNVRDLQSALLSQS